MSTNESEVRYYIAQNKKTSHVLHLLLSIITCGLWLPVWILVGISNADHNQKVNKKAREAAGMTHSAEDRMSEILMLLTKIILAIFILYVIATAVPH